MVKKSPVLYNVAKTFVWFAVVSLALTASLVAIVYLDHHREWKEYQKKFIALKVEKTREELQSFEQGIDKKKLEGLKIELAAAGESIKSNRSEVGKLQSQLGRLGTKLEKTKAEFQTLKQFQDSYRYFFEESRRHGSPEEAGYRKKWEEVTPKLTAAKLKLESLEKQKDETDARLLEFLSKEKAIQKEIDQMLLEKNRTERQLEIIKPSLAKDILNAPMIDFLAPSLKIQQVVLENLHDDYHFAKVAKVDRCTTCHLGIDQKGFSAEGGPASGGEDIPQPFRTHPNLDLYVGANSPHPIEKFGCTACHGGSGHSVSFVDSAHTPRDEKQKEDWVKKYHWRELAKWDAKMLPMNHVQASCAKCHTGTVEVPRAERLNLGRNLALQNGCFNCHKVKGFSAEGGSASGGESNWKAGPDLRQVRAKLSEEWVAKWLQDPAHFRPSTRMPAIFNLSNTSTPEDRGKNNAAIQSIAAYLAKNSEPAELSKPPVQGDGARGEGLLKTVGCLGCHSLPGVKGSAYGPELSGLGSKVSENWLYTWLKNPKHYSTETRMPNLRLSDPEAADITAYLLSLKNEAFDKSEAPKAKPSVVDEQILSVFQSTMRREEAVDALAKMNAEERLQWLGKKSIAHQGCYSCHTIKGFEDAKPIGTELSDEGRKDIHQFDFGFTDIERTRQAWIAQKLKEPRLFDQGKEKAYYEKLRMPQFHFTDDEIQALTTFLLSLSEEEMPLEAKRRLNLKEEAIEKGRFLVTKLNCNGCHALDGKTGTWRELAEDPALSNDGAAPPILDGEGAKVQEKWLHEFLKQPTTIRPWLKARMPTFEFSDAELETLVQYFAHLEKQGPSYGGIEIPETTPEKLEAGKKLFTSFQCAKCHEVSKESAAMGTSFLAPDLSLTQKRLKPEWIRQWLEDPQVLQPGTMMPTYFPEGQSPAPDVLEGDAQKQIQAIRDYLYRYEAEAPPPSAEAAKPPRAMRE